MCVAHFGCNSILFYNINRSLIFCMCECRFSENTECLNIKKLKVKSEFKKLFFLFLNVNKILHQMLQKHEIYFFLNVASTEMGPLHIFTTALKKLVAGLLVAYKFVRGSVS